MLFLTPGMLLHSTRSHHDGVRSGLYPVKKTSTLKVGEKLYVPGSSKASAAMVSCEREVVRAWWRESSHSVG